MNTKELIDRIFKEPGIKFELTEFENLGKPIHDMTTLNLTLPNSVQRHIQEMADMDGVPVSQFIITAVTEKISAFTAESYLRSRAERANPAEFQAILGKVPNRALLPGDE